MAMTPQERQEMEALKTTVKSLVEVRNVPFIEEIKRRVLTDTIVNEIRKTNLGDLANVTDNASTGQVIKKLANGTWQGADDIDT